MNSRGRRGAALSALIGLLGCNTANTLDRPPVPEASSPTEGRAVSVRFVIEVGPDGAGPIYVSLAEASGQPGWIGIHHGQERIFLRERCEVEDCGRSPVVCGPALQTVVDVASLSDRSVTLVWDGSTSVVRAPNTCETREPAPPGEYVARFCYSREVQVADRSDLTQPTVGLLLQPICVERAFGLEDAVVVLTL